MNVDAVFGRVDKVGSSQVVQASGEFSVELGDANIKNWYLMKVLQDVGVLPADVLSRFGQHTVEAALC